MAVSLEKGRIEHLDFARGVTMVFMALDSSSPALWSFPDLFKNPKAVRTSSSLSGLDYRSGDFVQALPVVF
jgi:uncharacterized membrane protein